MIGLFIGCLILLIVVPLVGFILVVALAFKNYEVMENEVQDEIQKSENNDRWN
jgi:hypothetical protein